MTEKPSQRVLICRMAASPDGANNKRVAEESRVPKTAIPQHMRALVIQGRIFQSRRTGAKLRWFDTEERAKQWQSMPPLVPSEYAILYPARQPRQVLDKKPGPPALIRYKTGFAPSVTVSKTDWNGRPVDSSNAVITVCPPFPQSRWDTVELAPDARYPSFSAQRYGS